MILRLLSLLFALGLLAGCQAEAPSGAESKATPPKAAEAKAEAPATEAQRRPAPASAFFPLQVGDETIQVQLAITVDEMRTGLMHRASMPVDKGMIFVFPQPRAQSFWMRNTLIPLDIAYIDPKGVILEIHQMEPLDETGTPSESDNIQYCLEMNQGWFEGYGVEVGDRIDLEQLATAVDARGFDGSVVRRAAGL